MSNNDANISALSLIIVSMKEEIGPENTCAVLAGLLCGISEIDDVDIEDVIKMLRL